MSDEEYESPSDETSEVSSDGYDSDEEDHDELADDDGSLNEFDDEDGDGENYEYYKAVSRAVGLLSDSDDDQNSEVGSQQDNRSDATDVESNDGSIGFWGYQNDDEDDGQRSATDSQNPDPYAWENDSYSVEYLLRVLRNEQPDDEWEEEIEYPDLTAQDIVNNTEAGDLQEVVEALLQDCIRDNDSFHFDFVQELVSLAEIEIDGYIANDCLEIAVNEENIDAVRFFVEQGANEESAIDMAIAIGFVELLEHYGVEADDANVRTAVENYPQSRLALELFFYQDFGITAEGVLDFALESRKDSWVRLVCEKAELNQVFDLIKYLIKARNERFIPIFFEYFEAEELLEAMYEEESENPAEDERARGIVLDCLKRYLLESGQDVAEIDELIAKFVQLAVTSDLQLYPKKAFNGSAALQALRTDLSNSRRLSNGQRVAVNLIGIPLSTANRYLAGSPYHKANPKKSEQYIRSGAQGHWFGVSVGSERARYQPHESLPEAKGDKGYGKAANLGLYRHPLDSLDNTRETKFARCASPKKALHIRDGFLDGHLYEGFLYYKHATSAYIVNRFNWNKNDFIKPGFYNDYPCVMVLIRTPEIARNSTKDALSGWTQIVISYFVGLVNYSAQRKGLDIELTRRSSFGFLTPTIADCDQSFRLNVGIIPNDYADVLVECLQILNGVLTNLNKGVRDLERQSLNINLPQNCFTKSQSYKTYMGGKKITSADNLLSLAWAQVDKADEKRGKTGAYNLTRTSLARDGLTAQVYGALSSARVFDQHFYVSAFLNALRWGFSKMSIRGKTLTFNTSEKFNFPSVLKANMQIEDVKFFEFFSSFLSEIRKEQKLYVLSGLVAEGETETMEVLERCIQKRSIENFYYHIEMLNELLYSRVIYTMPDIGQDAFDSDSEVEDEPEVLGIGVPAVYGKKSIVTNGMRAILGALHAGAHQLDPDYLRRGKLTKEEKTNLFLYGAYYETPAAIKLLGKFNLVKSLSDTEILIYDINACGKAGRPLRDLQLQELSKIKVLIIDTTSATIEKHHHWLEVFRQLRRAEVLFFVSSGFKNEQQGSDKNPYGTIRVFAKNKEVREKLITFIREKERPVHSVVSHHFRRMMKRMGNTPTNEVIMRFTPGPNPNAFWSTPLKFSDGGKGKAPCR